MPATKTKRKTKAEKAAELAAKIAEAKEKLPRRAKAWLSVNRAEQRLHKRRKVIESDLRAMTKVMPGKKWESDELLCKHVATSPVMKDDEDNIEMVLNVIAPEHKDIIFPPPKINSEALEVLYPDIYKKLKRSKGNRFEIDVKQAHQVGGNGQHS